MGDLAGISWRRSGFVSEMHHVFCIMHEIAIITEDSAVFIHHKVPFFITKKYFKYDYVQVSFIACWFLL